MKVRELNKKYYLKLHNNIIAILHQDNTLIIKIADGSHQQQKNA